jgi:hypothetical protein
MEQENVPKQSPDSAKSPEADQSQPLETDQAGFGEARENGLSARQEIDPYDRAEAVFNARLEQLQREGKIRRASEIADEWEQDDHFDDLSRLYRQICLEMGLEWPPPAKDETT